MSGRAPSAPISAATTAPEPAAPRSAGHVHGDRGAHRPAIAREIVGAHRVAVDHAGHHARVLVALGARAHARVVEEHPATGPAHVLGAEDLVAVHGLVVGGGLPAEEDA